MGNCSAKKLRRRATKLTLPVTAASCPLVAQSGTTKSMMPSTSADHPSHIEIPTLTTGTKDSHAPRTLWVEHPMYSQVAYCLYWVPAAKAKPELADVEPFKTVLVR